MAYFQTRHETLGKNLARVCSFNLKHITKVYLEALTTANFHGTRRKVAKLINKETGSKHRLGR